MRQKQKCISDENQQQQTELVFNKWLLVLLNINYYRKKDKEGTDKLKKHEDHVHKRVTTFQIVHFPQKE